MGYFTSFQFLNTEDELKKIQNVASKIFKDKMHDILCVLAKKNGAELKWYDWDEDLEKLSSHPELKDVEIFLRGIGEETCDLWEAKALNGMVITKRPKVIFPTWEGRKMPNWDLEFIEEKEE